LTFKLNAAHEANNVLCEAERFNTLLPSVIILLTIFAMRIDFFMVVELSWFQVEDVKSPHSGPSTASTTNSTFNYGRDNPERLRKGK